MSDSTFWEELEPPPTTQELDELLEQEAYINEGDELSPPPPWDDPLY